MSDKNGEDMLMPDLVLPGAAQAETPPGLYPWELQHPTHPLVFFVATGGQVEVRLGYAVYGRAILLVAIVKTPGTEAQLWRRHWASSESALRSAENLCAEAEEYLTETLGWKSLRPAEDLDYEDFLDHLKARLNNDFH